MRRNDSDKDGGVEVQGMPEKEHDEELMLANMKILQLQQAQEQISLMLADTNTAYACLLERVNHLEDFVKEMRGW